MRTENPIVEFSSHFVNAFKLNSPKLNNYKTYDEFKTSRKFKTQLKLRGLFILAQNKDTLAIRGQAALNFIIYIILLRSQTTSKLVFSINNPTPFKHSAMDQIDHILY